MSPFYLSSLALFVVCLSAMFGGLRAFNHFTTTKATPGVWVAAITTTTTTRLNGVLSPSQIVAAAKNRSFVSTTTTTTSTTNNCRSSWKEKEERRNSRQHVESVLEEITWRQERVLDALDRQLSKNEDDDDDGTLVSVRRSESVRRRREDVGRVLRRARETRDSLIDDDDDDEATLVAAREAIVDMGFERLLDEDPVFFASSSSTRRGDEFGRPRGFDGLVRHSPSLGVPILVGARGAQNDELLRRVSQGTDLWFQVEDYRGSRVLLRSSLVRGSKGSRSCAQAAADLAAYHSDSRREERVRVMYTDPRHVAKRGSKVGRMRKRKSLGTMVGRPRAVAEAETTHERREGYSSLL